MKTFTNWLKWLTSQQKKKTMELKKSKDIYQILEERKTMETRALVYMPKRDGLYWLMLPAYANLFIRPAYEKIGDVEGLIEFCNYFLKEYSESENAARNMSIEAIVMPLYKSITGRNYDTNLLTAYDIK